MAPHCQETPGGPPCGDYMGHLVALGQLAAAVDGADHEAMTAAPAAGDVVAEGRWVMLSAPRHTPLHQAPCCYLRCQLS